MVAREHDRARAEVVALVNRIRRRAGLRPLRYSRRLQRAAQGHAEDMNRKNYLSHTSKDGREWWQRVYAAGWPRGAHVAENIARGFDDARRVVEAWMDSPEHRKQILDRDNRAIGVGISDGYWVQNFGGR